MKTLKVGLIVVAVSLLVIIAGGLIFLSTLDVNRYIPQVADAVAKATGRELKVGHGGLAFSIDKGAVLELNNVTLSDDLRFSDKSFISASQVVLAFDVWAALAAKSIVISDVSIINPVLTVIRGRDGSINAASFQAAPSSSAPSSVQSSPVAAPAAAVVLPAMLVKKVQVTGGSLHYIDRLFDPAIAVDIDKISLGVRNLSLNAPFDVTLSAAVFGADPNFSASGRAAVNMAALSLKLEQVKASLILDKIAPARLNDVLSIIKPAIFKQIRGSLDVTIIKVVLGVKGMEEIDAQVDLNAKEAVLEGINIFAAGLNSIPMFPDLASAVLADLPPETQEDIRKGITVIDRLDVSMLVRTDLVTVSKVDMSTRDMAVSGNGTLKLPPQASGELDMAVKFFISPKLSELLVKKVTDLGGLKGEDGRVYIPFSVNGPMLKPKVLPDLEYLSKKLLINRGKQELEKVLNDPAVGKAVGELLNSIFKSK